MRYISNRFLNEVGIGFGRICYRVLDRGSITFRCYRCIECGSAGQCGNTAPHLGPDHGPVIIVDSTVKGEIQFWSWTEQGKAKTWKLPRVFKGGLVVGVGQVVFFSEV